MQVNSSSALLGAVLLGALLVFLLWGVAHEWWVNRRRRRLWARTEDTASVGSTRREEADELGLVEDGEP